jgi:hypothetical protein
MHGRDRGLQEGGLTSPSSSSGVHADHPAAAPPRADHTLYDTAATVRTIELILGLHPPSPCDANATSMWRPFESEPTPRPADLAPFDARAESIPPT